MSYRSLQTFLAVVEHGSFSAAARHSGVTPAAVGKSIRDLEEELQSRLFHRNTHHLALTEDGKHLLAEIAHPMKHLQTTLDSLKYKDEEPSGGLKMNLPESFGKKFILPLIPEFLALYPKIALDIFLQDKRVDPIGEGFDISIGNMSDPDSRLIARKLCAIELVTVASHSYLNRNKAPSSPDDLVRHNCIAYRQLATGRVVPWRFKVQQNDLAITPKGNLIVSNIEAAVTAAVDGIGIATVGRWHTMAAIQSGQLVEVLKAFRPDPLPVFLYFATRENQPGRVRAMIDYLLTKAREGHFSNEHSRRI